MSAFEIAAQAVGILAMVFNIFSFQQKSSGRVIAFQMCGGALFAVNFFMLGATVGGIMNTIAVFRAAVYMNKKRLHADHIAWLIFFMGLYAAAYVLTFTVFEKPFTGGNAVIELLPVIGMTATNVGFRRQNAGGIRKLGLISSPAWLIYNIINFAIGAIICEVLSLCSIFIGMYRHDRGQKAPQIAE
jgi:hypothetical protein